MRPTIVANDMPNINPAVPPTSDMKFSDPYSGVSKFNTKDMSHIILIIWYD